MTHSGNMATHFHLKVMQRTYLSSRLINNIELQVTPYLLPASNAVLCEAYSVYGGSMETATMYRNERVKQHFNV